MTLLGSCISTIIFARSQNASQSLSLGCIWDLILWEGGCRGSAMEQFERKLKHANSILKSFEYFCQMSLKSILIILIYTVSKMVCFLDTV